LDRIAVVIQGLTGVALSNPSVWRLGAQTLPVGDQLGGLAVQPGQASNMRTTSSLRTRSPAAFRLILQPHLLFASLIVCATGAGLVAAPPS
jgi:hypothetical protein